MTDKEGGNGHTLQLATCEACEVPGRVGRVELKVMRAESDIGALMAAIRSEGDESRHRDDCLRTAMGDVHRIVAEILQSIRAIEDKVA